MVDRKSIIILFPFRMYKNERVIHLGKNKSPGHSLLHTRGQSLTCKESQHPLQPSLNGNESIIFHNEPPRERIVSFPKPLYSTCEGFVRIQGQSRQKNSYPIDSLQNTKISSINQHAETEKQLVSKISILERRIKQLHDQKQHYMRKSHQQIQRLLFENQVLRLKVQELDLSRNKQLRVKTNDQSEISVQQYPINIKNDSPSFGIKEPKNSVSSEEDDSISINLHLENNIAKQAKRECCWELEQQYRQMQNQIDQLFNVCMKAGILNQSSLMEKQFKQNGPSKLKLISLHIQNGPTKVENRDPQIIKLKLQIQSLVQILEKNNQELMKAEVYGKQQKKKCDFLQQKAKKLSEQIEQQKAQGGKQNVAQVCPKCKDYVKALVKLNQRVYTGAIVNY